MRRHTTLLLTALAAAIVLTACTQHPQHSLMDESDSTVSAINSRLRNLYDDDAGQALTFIDSVEEAGLLNHFATTLLRAQVYSHDEATLPECSRLCRQMLDEGSLSLREQAAVLDVMMTAVRMRQGDEQILHYGTQYIDICRQLGDDTKALTVQAELGQALIRLGRQEEGLARIDESIRRLSTVRRFSEMDACVRTLKRKISVLTDLGRYEEAIPLSERILQMLADFGEHPDDYADGSVQMPDAERRPGYIDFYSGQAYAFMAYAYAMTGRDAEARESLRRYGLTAYSSTLSGRKLVSSSWFELGEYDKMEAIYDELDSVWGGDTVHSDYALSLHNRALAANARGQHRQGFAYLQRYIALDDVLNDAERVATAQEQAARYYEQEQQLALERQREATRHAWAIARTVGLVALLVIVFAVILLRQMRSIRRKNAVLTRSITERMERSAPTPPPAEPTEDELSAMDNGQLFRFLCRVITDEELYRNPLFDRQLLIDRYHLSKDRIGAAFAHGGGTSLAAFVNDCRVRHSARLLAEKPQMPMAEVASDSGFSNGSVFARNFKLKYAITPSEFRKESLLNHLRKG